MVVCAVLAGAVASVAGFGIGSILTPLLTLSAPAKVAVAAVAIPHAVATAYRLWLVRRFVDLKLLRSFGAASAAGGLVGAVVQRVFASRWLEVVLACLLIFVGVSAFFGYVKRMRFSGWAAWVAGGVSGLLGGLVGNQGGLRAGAMTGLGVERDAFVATATATGLIVDSARLPVYFAGFFHELLRLWPTIAAMTLAVVLGTIAGAGVLRKIPQAVFERVVSLLLVALGIWLIAKGS